MTSRTRWLSVASLLALGCGSPSTPDDVLDARDALASDMVTADQGSAASDALDALDAAAPADAPATDTPRPLDAATDVARPLDAAADVVAPRDVVTPTDVVMRTDAGMNASAGCGRTGMPTGYRASVSIMSGGATRTYAFSVPADYNPARAYPLVFVFHGDGGTGAGVRTGLPIEAAAGTNAIFVYPDATTASGRSFDLETPLATNADIRLFQDLVASVRAQYCVDNGRIFAAGSSRGAFFSNILNCRVGSSVLRAIGPHSGSIYAADASGYTTDGHVRCEGTAASAMVIHGQSDTTVPLTDGVYARDQWIWADGCMNTTRAYTPSPCVEYNGCTSSRRVVWCAIPSLGHATWSMAGAALWSFFSSF